jgi:membrane protease subunit (stomatin/prohibitin family)
LQKVLDQRISMGLIGDMSKFTQYQTAQSIPIAAGNEGGAAGIGAGLGAGLTIGQTMATSMAGAMQPPKPPTDATVEVMALLEKLHDLMSKGVLTKEEFEAKKVELLKKLS